MPKEIFSKKKFLELAQYARECRVKRLGDTVKLKLRLKRYLYTYKTNPKEAEELLKAIKCPVREI